MDLRTLLMTSAPADALRELHGRGELLAFEPAVAALRMPKLPGVHHKDNLEHSFQVLENAMERESDGPDLLLRTAALLHDVGKPATRKPAARKTVTFDGHEAVGAKMMPAILKRHGYSGAEVKLVAELVKLHMRSHGFEEQGWSDSGVRRLLTDVSSPLQLQRLLVLFYADVTTKNSTLRARWHKSTDDLAVRLAEVQAADARKSLRPALDGHQVMELFGLTPGPELGRVMRFLNGDEGVALSREEALSAVKALLK